MTSPTSFVPSHMLSTPGITVTADDGRAASVDLRSESLVGRPKSLTFDIPQREQRTTPDMRPEQPEWAKGSEDATVAKAGEDKKPEQPAKSEVEEPRETPQPGAVAPAAPGKKPESKQTGSLRLLTDLKKTLSSTNLRKDAGKASSIKDGGGKSSTKTSEGNSPQTLEVRELFQNRNGAKGKTTLPDLDAVDRALESLKTSSSDDPYVSKLTRLAASLKNVRTDSRKALTDAMKERDRGNTEICRGLCLGIVQAEHSEVDMKVYAYNILSTQASPGQGMNYLAAAWNLVKQYEGKRSDCEKLLGVVAMLKENAVAKGGKAAVPSKLADFANEIGLGTIERSPTIPKEVVEPATVRELLKVPAPTENSGIGEGGSGAMSPRTEKILNWAKIS